MKIIYFGQSIESNLSFVFIDATKKKRHLYLPEHIIVKARSATARWPKMIKISTIASLSFNVWRIKRIESGTW